MNTTPKLLLAVALGAGLHVGGCATVGTRYTHPNADLGAIQTVAVLPFESLTPDRTAGEKVQRVFMVELLALGVVDVIEPGQVAKVGAGQRLDPGTLTPEDLKRIGEALGADGLFLGTVVDFQEGRVGTVPAPEVTVQLRLVEVLSGKTIWTASDTRAGANVSARLFGFGGDSLTEAARELVKRQLKTLL